MCYDGAMMFFQTLIFQCRNERKSVPQVLSITGNVDCGLMAFLFNSLQQLEKKDGKQRLQHRKVNILDIIK